MALYRKRPVVIEAHLWDREHPHPDVRPCREAHNKHMLTAAAIAAGGDYHGHIKTREGEMTIRLGYYVIHGVQGEVYGCDPVIFWETYERVWEKEA